MITRHAVDAFIDSPQASTIISARKVLSVAENQYKNILSVSVDLFRNLINIAEGISPIQSLAIEKKQVSVKEVVGYVPKEVPVEIIKRIPCDHQAEIDRKLDAFLEDESQEMTRLKLLKDEAAKEGFSFEALLLDAKKQKAAPSKPVKFVIADHEFEVAKCTEREITFTPKQLSKFADAIIEDYFGKELVAAGCHKNANGTWSLSNWPTCPKHKMKCGERIC